MKEKTKKVKEVKIKTPWGETVGEIEDFKDKPFYLSKKYWAAVLAVLIPLSNKIFSWELNPDELIPIILPILAYIIGQGFADSKKGITDPKELDEH